MILAPDVARSKSSSGSRRAMQWTAWTVDRQVADRARRPWHLSQRLVPTATPVHLVHHLLFATHPHFVDPRALERLNPPSRGDRGWFPSGLGNNEDDDDNDYRGRRGRRLIVYRCPSRFGHRFLTAPVLRLSNGRERHRRTPRAQCVWF